MNTLRISMLWKRPATLLLFVATLALVVAACEGDPTPTNTSVPPTNTPTAVPTNTATPRPTNTPTRVPTATPTPTPVPARLGTEEVRTSLTEVPFAGSSVVWVYGSGFEPGQEVQILIMDKTGVLADITSGLTSVFPLIANEQGAWATKWTIGRFTTSAVEGQYSLTIVDALDFDVLATAPIALCAPTRAEGAAIPNFCSK